MVLGGVWLHVYSPDVDANSRGQIGDETAAVERAPEVVPRVSKVTNQMPGRASLPEVVLPGWGAL
jgi:hypothetical protein